MIDKTAPNTLTAKLPGELKAYIFRADNTLSANEPIYAINWFNTKTQWVYDFYNFLAVKAVKKIGGGPFFKGKHTKTLYGEDESKRDILLVVRYPSLQNFRTMLEDKYFQLVSLIRIAAVKNFTFGISKRVDAGADFQPMVKADNKKTAYAVHHYSGPNDISAELQGLTANSAVDIFFNSQIKAHIATGKSQENCELVVCIIENVLILSAADEDDIIAFTQASPYQNLIQKTETSFIGLYSRVL